jgi:hypothetical protein
LEITEQDIFVYVFNREVLSQDKISAIETSDKYQEQIKFFNSLKKELAADISFYDKIRIAKKIPLYKVPEFIELFPLKKTKTAINNQVLILAAASPEIPPKFQTKTFIDNEKQFLIKLVTSEKESKIFVFSTTDEELHKLRLIISPGEVEYRMKDNSQPLILNGSVNAESIKIGFY